MLPLHSGKDLVEHYLNESVVSGDGNENSTAVRAYKEWSLARGDRVLRPLDPLNTPLHVKKREMYRICDFGIWLCHTRGIRASSANDYISTVNAWHRRRTFVGLAANADRACVLAVLKGVARTHTPLRPTLTRIGIVAHHLAAGMDIVFGKRGKGTAQEQNYRALMASCFAGLLRGCEACFQDNKALRFQFLPQRKHIQKLANNATGLVIREAKRSSLKDITPFSESTIQLYPGGSYIDACAEISTLLTKDPASPSDALFRKSNGQPIKVSELRDAVKAVARSVGLDPSFFGAHSLRCHCKRALSFILHLES